MLKVLQKLLIIKKYFNTIIHHNYNATIRPELIFTSVMQKTQGVVFF